VIYEYANQLVARGHVVTVVHSRAIWHMKRPLHRTLYYWIIAKFRQLCNWSITVEVPWYKIDSRVRMIAVPEFRTSYIPDGDAIFQTLAAGKFPKEKGMEFVLMQGYKQWPKDPTKMDDILKSPMFKIAVSKWLYKEGLKLGVPEDEITYIPNGIDLLQHRLLQSIEHRPPRVAMMYDTRAIKGSGDGISALQLTRKSFPALEATLFGIVPRPKWLPGWIEYSCDPPREELVGSIYNGSSIFLCPSWVEGFGLPPAEAMACGCAVVSTDSGGVLDFAEHEVIALLSPPKNPTALAENLLRLLEDDGLRIKLAKAGHERIQEFTWERSTDLLERFIMDKIGWPGARE